MATWAIGDLQGCYDPTARLLEAIKFDPATDHLWFCGDLVNRGGQSLRTLRLVKSLDIHSNVVLGNHDLSLIAIAQRNPDEQRKVNPDLREILFADDRDELLDWLRKRPLMHVDRSLGWAMVHAGLAPRWSISDAEGYAREVQERLHGPNYRKLLSGMYGNKPEAFTPKLSGPERMRAIINVFTRLRFCTPRGALAFSDKGPPGSQKIGAYPWFEVPGMVKRDLRIVCGHWSTLGLFQGLGVHAIDTGCVWGGKLTAIRLDDEIPRIVQVPGREGAKLEEGSD
jgi:bis(5'-nucleosyl)-tetraphosphatase (symmetrical)